MSQIVLFDLEGTLVNVDAIAHHREARHWRSYAAEAGKTVLYPGVAELLAELAKRKIPWAIVTNIVSNAAEAVVNQHGLSPMAMVCYHDAKPKPHPAGCNLALSKLAGTAGLSLGVGDADPDAQAFAAAGVPGYCAGWNPQAQQSVWKAVLKKPTDLFPLLKK